MCSCGIVQSTVHVTSYVRTQIHGFPRNSVVDSCEWPCDQPWIACALSTERPCSVRGTSVLHPLNVGVLYAAYPGSDWWTLRILCYVRTCAQRKTPNKSGR